jgi:hypothetical protein
MVIRYRSKIGLPGFEPAFGRAGLAFRAVPVAAGVIGDFVMFTDWAMQHMPA